MDIRELEKLQRFINDLPQKLKQAVELTVRRSAEKIQADLSTIFKTEGRSHGIDWAPLKEKYLKQKVKKGFSEKKLHRTTTLAQSFTYKIEDVYKALIGTPVPYSIYHEYGTRKMPARPFMQPAIEKFIKENHIEKLFGMSFQEVLNG